MTSTRTTLTAILVTVASAACSTVATREPVDSTRVFCPTVAAHEHDPLLAEDLRTAAMWLESEGWGEVRTAEAGDDACTFKVKFGDEEFFSRYSKSVAAVARLSGITLRASRWDRWIDLGITVDILAHEMGHILNGHNEHSDSGIMAAVHHGVPLIEGTRE